MQETRWNVKKKFEIFSLWYQMVRLEILSILSLKKIFFLWEYHWIGKEKLCTSKPFWEERKWSYYLLCVSLIFFRKWCDFFQFFRFSVFRTPRFLPGWKSEILKFWPGAPPEMPTAPKSLRVWPRFAISGAFSPSRWAILIRPLRFADFQFLGGHPFI